MKLTITHTLDSQSLAALLALTSGVTSLNQGFAAFAASMGKQMADLKTTVADLVTKVANLTTVEAGLKAVVDNTAAFEAAQAAKIAALTLELTNAGVDPALVQQVADAATAIQTNADAMAGASAELATALTTNTSTPAAPVA